jgi:predicted O-methyltransferase YrrM
MVSQEDNERAALLEVDPRHAEVAQNNIKQAGVADVV